MFILADMESFYASVEIAKNPSLKNKPVVVCGDPQKRHGIALAANKEAKRYGIKTGMPAWQCYQLCPDVSFVRPHMSSYLDVSLEITKILGQFTDRVFPYSVDEQFLDITNCEKLFGSPVEIALKINKEIFSKTGVRCRCGIGENPLQAKMACDCFAKKNPDGYFQLSNENYARYVWPLPIRKLFGVGSRMGRNLKRIGILRIGDLAKWSKNDLVSRWGINGEVLWLNAHGIDNSTVQTSETCKGVGHSMTLPRDYTDITEIKLVLLEITEEVCRRARSLGKIGGVIALYCRGADFNNPTGFFRQKKLPQPTAITMDAYRTVVWLFEKNWDKSPIRSIGVNLLHLIDDSNLQLTLFENTVKKFVLSKTMDHIREQYGTSAIFRASSLTSGSQFFERINKIGGHEA